MNRNLFIFLNEKEERAILFPDFELQRSVKDFVLALTTSETLRKALARQAKEYGSSFYPNKMSVTDFVKRCMCGTKFIYDEETDSWLVESDEILVSSTLAEKYEVKK